MRFTNPLVAVLCSIALVPAATFAGSISVYAASPGTVTATTTYPNGGTHNAVDIAPGRCNADKHKLGPKVSWAWTVSAPTTGKVCNGGGANNYVSHTLPGGYLYEEMHFIKTADSRSRTCNRCNIGNVGGTGQATGPHAHQAYRKHGTKLSTWYTVKRGQKVTYNTKIGTLKY
jgi:hypothetical protein